MRSRRGTVAQSLGISVIVRDGVIGCKININVCRRCDAVRTVRSGQATTILLLIVNCLDVRDNRCGVGSSRHFSPLSEIQSFRRFRDGFRGCKGDEEAVASLGNQ